MTARRRWILLLATSVAMVATRAPLLEGQGLWADEVFSLAIATGHSLEHPAADAAPDRGDFVETALPRPSTDYARYTRHEGGAGLGRVLRAVRLSDTSPPLYYLLLHLWTRAAGCGDAALRGFSLLWAIACLPLLIALASRLAGPGAALAACFVFAFAPVSVYYSTEGRMYSLLWFCVLLLIHATLALSDRGAKAGAALWVVASVAGLLTHYFFVFAWCAAVLWVVLRPGAAGRRPVAIAAGACCLLAGWWYAGVPGDIGRWRVTKGWLMLVPAGFDAWTAPLALAQGYVSGGGPWGRGWPGDRLSALVYAAVFGSFLVRDRRDLLRGPFVLLWLLAAVACLAPPALDLLRGTYMANVRRYALSGMPAAFLLLGGLLGRRRPATRAIVLAAMSLFWVQGFVAMQRSRSRCWSPNRDIGREVVARSTGDDVVIVHSIPSGAIAVARYMEEPRPLATWVGQLGRRRVPGDLAALAAGRRRVVLVEVHRVGEPAPEEELLRRVAVLRRDDRLESARILEFTPPGGGRFAAAQFRGGQSSRR